MQANFKILDTTIRDGSYAINFNFTASDTAIISKKLEEAGIPYIEIGHGVGFNGSEKHGKALETDEAYLKATAEVLSTSKFGMFCIPGIARLSDIDMAADYDMGFVRVGTDVNKVESSEAFIDKAKSKGMLVAANFMKSYSLSPKEFAQKVKVSESYGADTVYVVDSAGGMFPKDVRAYYEAIREVTDISLGFHGHNNLMLGNANTLEAIECGYNIVDTSLQGMGRSAGNACTETLVAALIKLGYDLDYDYRALLDIGQTYIMPLYSSNGRHPLDITAGFADFHTSYMRMIHRYSAKYSVDPILLMQEITKIDKVSIKESDLDKLASELEKEENLYIGKFNFSRYFGEEQG